MKFTRRALTTSITATTASMLSSCGTIFYPDRRTSRKDGTMSGEIDILILGLNTVGLFFFIVPGIVAFAVDFGTGAIFLPEGGKQMDEDERTLFDELNEDARIDTPVQSGELVSVIRKKTGHDLSSKDVLAMRIDSLDQAALAYHRLHPANRIADR